MGVLVLATKELVTDTVLNLVHGIAEDVIGLLVLEAAVLIVLDFEVVAFFRTHVGALSEGDIILAGLGAIALPGHICNVVELGGAPFVQCSVYRELGDCPFEVVHDMAEVASSALIRGEAVEDLITMGDEATKNISIL